MLLNSEIKTLLKRIENTSMKGFAIYLGMHPNGLRKRLNNNDIKMSLYPAYISYLKRGVEKDE